VIYLYNSSGLVNSSLSTFVNFTGLDDGTYYLNATANDTFGNKNSTETRMIVIDTVPPTINIHSPLNITYGANVLVNLSHGGDNIWYNWNGTNVTYGGEVNVTFDEGVNTLVVYANDSCGNTNVTNVTFTVDNTPPNISIVSPLNQSYDNATILVNISSDGDNVWYNWNGTNYTYSSEVNVTFAEGANVLYVWANDSLGNLGYGSVIFTIDLTSPVVSLISPVNSSTVTVSLTVDFKYNVTDDSSIENCSLIINDVFNSVDTVIAKDVTQSFSVVLANGDYNWSVNCTDEVGNENSSETENFTLAYVASVTPATPTGGGGGGGSYAGDILECIDDSGCGVNQYCLDNKCLDFECDSDLDCNDTKTCWMHRCVKLFDMKIEDVESPIFPGESFGFTYFLKGVAEIHGDVIVNFWLEKDGEIVTEGFDTIYMADFDEKTETTELFLPATIASGTYNFYAEVEYDSYYARASRVIEVVKIPEEPGVGILTGRAIVNIGDVIKTNAYFILVLVSILILFGIIYWERREIRKILYPEARWVKRHKVSIGTFLFFVVLVGVLFYADRADMIKLSPLRMSLVKYLYIAGLIAVLAIILARVRIRNLFGHLGRFVKSLFVRKRGLEVRERVSVKPKVVKVKPKVRKMEVKPKVVKKKIVRRKKRKPRAKSLLEKSHPKLFKELKEPKVKLRPTKVKPMKESSSADRELERAKSMKDKISSIGEKRVVKNSHPNIKKEVKEIKSAMSRSK